MPIIAVNNLCKSFYQKTVLNDISFSVESGDYLYIVGENGTGKTTLIKLLLGLIEPDSGEIKFEGFNRNEIGYLPQVTDIQNDFPAGVAEVVLSGTLNRKKNISFYNRNDREKAAMMMERLSVSDLKKSSFKELSGGQKQRVLLARALCATEKVLLMDEPITGLDPVATTEFYKITEELRAAGITIIIISHDISCAVHYGNRILHLCDNSYYFGTADNYAKTPLGKKMLAGGHCHD